MLFAALFLPALACAFGLDTPGVKTEFSSSLLNNVREFTHDIISCLNSRSDGAHAAKECSSACHVPSVDSPDLKKWPEELVKATVSHLQHVDLALAKLLQDNKLALTSALDLMQANVLEVSLNDLSNDSKNNLAVSAEHMNRYTGLLLDFKKTAVKLTNILSSRPKNGSASAETHWKTNFLKNVISFADQFHTATSSYVLAQTFKLQGDTLAIAQDLLLAELRSILKRRQDRISFSQDTLALRQKVLANTRQEMATNLDQAITTTDTNIQALVISFKSLSLAEQKERAFYFGRAVLKQRDRLFAEEKKYANVGDTIVSINSNLAILSILKAVVAKIESSNYQLESSTAFSGLQRALTVMLSEIKEKGNIFTEKKLLYNAANDQETAARKRLKEMMAKLYLSQESHSTSTSGGDDSEGINNFMDTLTAYVAAANVYGRVSREIQEFSGAIPFLMSKIDTLNALFQATSLQGILAVVDQALDKVVHFVESSQNEIAPDTE